MSNAIQKMMEKALSTSSEDEAIAALRMARKKSTQADSDTSFIVGKSAASLNDDMQKKMDMYRRKATHYYKLANTTHTQLMLTRAKLKATQALYKQQPTSKHQLKVYAIFGTVVAVISALLF